MKTVPVFIKGKIVGEVKVDDEDYEIVKRFKLNATPRRNGNGYKMVLIAMPLSRFLLNAKKDMEVDHRNRDPFDNRKENLRECTHSQNMANRRFKKSGGSIHKGVTRCGKKWRTQVRHGGKTKHLGTFDTEIDAAKAFNIHAQKIYGEYATLNNV